MFRARKNGKKVIARRVEAVYLVEGLDDYHPVISPIFEFNRVEDSLNEGNSLAKALNYVEDIQGVELDHELALREEFLKYMTLLGIKRAEDFWSVYVKFRRNPEHTLEELKKAVAKRKEWEMPTKYQIVASLEEIKFCPRCGAELEPGSPTCLKCGFKLVIKREVE